MFNFDMRIRRWVQRHLHCNLSENEAVPHGRRFLRERSLSWRCPKVSIHLPPPTSPVTCRRSTAITVPSHAHYIHLQQISNGGLSRTFLANADLQGGQTRRGRATSNLHRASRCVHGIFEELRGKAWHLTGKGMAPNW